MSPTLNSTIKIEILHACIVRYISRTMCGIPSEGEAHVWHPYKSMGNKLKKRVRERRKWAKHTELELAQHIALHTTGEPL